MANFPNNVQYLFRAKREKVHVWNQRQYFINNIFDSNQNLRFVPEDDEEQNSRWKIRNSTKHVSRKESELSRHINDSKETSSRTENGMKQITSLETSDESELKKNHKTSTQSKNSHYLGIFVPPLPVKSKKNPQRSKTGVHKDPTAKKKNASQHMHQLSSRSVPDLTSKFELNEESPKRSEEASTSQGQAVAFQHEAEHTSELTGISVKENNAQKSSPRQPFLSRSVANLSPRLHERVSTIDEKDTDTNDVKSPRGTDSQPILPVIQETSFAETMLPGSFRKHTPQLTRPYLEREATEEKSLISDMKNSVSLPNIAESDKHAQTTGKSSVRKLEADLGQHACANINARAERLGRQSQDWESESEEEQVLCEPEVIKSITSTLPMSLMMKANHNINKIVSEQKQKLIAQCKKVTEKNATSDPRFLALKQILQPRDFQGTTDDYF